MKPNRSFKKILTASFSALLSCLILFAILFEFFSINSGLFRDTTCQAPCWNNLIPGQTTLVELDQYLVTLNSWKWTERWEYQYDNGCRATRIAQNNITGGLMDFNVIDGKLAIMQLHSSTTFGSLHKVVNRYGPPESIEVILTIGVDYDNYAFKIFYPSKGFAISLDTDYEDRGYIKSNMKIRTVEYFPPGNLLSYLTTKASCAFGHDKAVEMAKKEIEIFVQPWPGFREVKPAIDLEQ
jgi:hypothetical protein